MKHLVSGLRIFFLLIAMTVTLSANTSQGHFRWRNDDGTETSASWRQSQDENDTLKAKSRIRIRIELHQTTPPVSVSGALALYYSTDNVNFNEITDDSTFNDWVLSRSSIFSDSAATTEQLSMSGSSFVSGLMVDSTVPIGFAIASSASSEYEFSIAPTTHASSGTLYHFRLEDPNDLAIVSAWDRTPTLLYLNGVTAFTGSATSVGSTSATVSGSVYPDNGSATVRILYSTSPASYTDSVYASPSSVNGNSVTSVSRTLTGLSRSTTYYYTVAAAGANYSRGMQLQFTTTNDIAGYGLKFNGSPDSECVEAPVVTTSILNFTLEGWVKWNGSTSNNQFLFYNGNSGSTGFGVYLDHTNSDKVSVLAGGNFIANSRFTLPIGAWTHVAMTCDLNATWIIYVNGERDSVHSGTSNGVGMSDGFFIGGHSGTPSETFYGTIDEVRFWSSALDSSTIRRNMHLVLPATTSGLANCYEFTDTTGVTATDVVAQNNGTLVNFIFDATDGWVTSTAPIGGGASADSGGFSSGTATLGTLAASMTDPFDNPIDFVVTGITVPPDSLPTGSAVLLNSQYWVVTPYGTPGTFSANLTFTVPSSFTANGAESPTTYTLYHRADNADGSWTPLLTSASGVTTSTITFTGVTSFSEFMIGSSDNSLPVEALDFLARTDVNSVTLSWKTISEVDNAGFNVLRHDQAAHSFSVISSFSSNARLNGAGTSTAPRTYSFADKDVVSGTTYSYKIQSVSRAGVIKDIGTLTVTINAPKSYALYQNYPNPFNPSTTIRFDLKQPSAVTLEVYNILGQKVLVENKGMMNAGRYDEVLDMTKYSSGMYVYRIVAVGSTGEKYISLKKMLLMK